MSRRFQHGSHRFNLHRRTTKVIAASPDGNDSDADADADSDAQLLMSPSAPGAVAASYAARSRDQGLALVHFSAQLERFLWNWGCA